MIEFCDVTFKHHYDDFALLQNASFTLQNGLNTLLCDVQSGKTSICKLILGLLKPNAGKIFVDGADVLQTRPDVLYLPQNPTFFEHKTVQYNLEYPARVRKILPQTREHIAELAHIFALDNVLECKVKKLAPDQKHLLALARGLTVPRKVVLFDDFFDNTTGAESAISFADVAKNYFCAGQTAVQFTSSPQQAVGHTVVMDDKKCVYQGDAQFACNMVQSLWVSCSPLLKNIDRS